MAIELDQKNDDINSQKRKKMTTSTAVGYWDCAQMKDRVMHMPTKLLRCSIQLELQKCRKQQKIFDAIIIPLPMRGWTPTLAAGSC